MMKKYDVIVLGSGGGAKITSPAARMGLKVACIEKDALGGTCLNRGCIPSKMLIHPADVAVAVREASRFDIRNDTRIHVDFAKLVTRISHTVDLDSSKIAAGYAQNPQIDFYHTEGRFTANKTILAAGQEITADKIVIAVGARPQIPDIEGLKGTPFMTSTEALRNTRLPRKMIVIGGGYIAAELGHAYGALGAEIHFLVRTSLLRHEDRQTAEEFTRLFSKRHHIYPRVVPVKVRYASEEFTVTFRNPDGKYAELTADALLVAAGIVPNNDTLDLHNTDIALTDQGFLKVNDRLQTTVPGVYGLGDCVGNYFYRHTVNFEGEYLLRTVFEHPSDEPIRYPPVPHAIFTHPQVAGVGKTEEQLRAEGIDYVAGVNPYAKSAMGMALLAEGGFVKILIDCKTRVILGAHIVGDEASASTRSNAG
jgi:dihydrolipoamide dehydrogenase